MNVLFRTNAGKEGLGHLNRIYSLYNAFNKLMKIEAYFLVNNNAKDQLIQWGITSELILTSEKYDGKDIKIIREICPDILILDTYKASRDYILSIKQDPNIFLVLFDDNILYSGIKVDILINGNIYATNLDYDNKIIFNNALFGPKYLAMNSDFWNDNFKVSNDISTILITCGGSDPVNVMSKLIKSLKNINLKKKIVIGPFFSNKQIKNIEKRIDKSYEIIYKPIGLKNIISDSDLVLTASGSTIYEVLSLRKIPIIYIISVDQIQIAKEFEKEGLLNIGWYYNINHILLKKLINKSKESEYRKYLEPLYDIYDGKGSLRIASKILSLYKN